MPEENAIIYICMNCGSKNKFYNNDSFICMTCRDCRMFRKQKNPISVLMKAR
jgi:DNA-directed RNA polymerase subunit RPC12/RpoP